ncbi:MAG: hypothetical protein VR64_01925 [Desulfatitalea sp. BRH_c12]|nr:MAG: hypothetical protein VR64_01925 [Desulfatitalea sp. BRH_c12]
MDGVKTLSRPIAFWVGFFNMLACLVLIGASYWGLQSISKTVLPLAQNTPGVPEIERLARWTGDALQWFWPALAPAAVLFFLVLTLLTWLVLRSRVKKRLPSPTTARPRAAKPSAASKAEDTRQTLEMNQRIFLHLIATLQKEGRLLDFFSEDLAQYDDGQIGAAVRNIHENCKKTIHKYLAPQAVVDREEGEEISVDKDFDANELKLVGNVTGHPPFKGIVRHRGWRTRKIDLPTLSGQQDPGIIAPAEIEII